jgi:hypothetical protein
MVRFRCVLTFPAHATKIRVIGTLLDELLVFLLVLLPHGPICRGRDPPLAIDLEKERERD